MDITEQVVRNQTSNQTSSSRESVDSKLNQHTALSSSDEIIESTAGRPNEIQAIDKSSVHRICSGQVSLVQILKI